MLYRAIAIDTNYFYYLCPQEKCPVLVHRHGSRGDAVRNRVESRSCHCPEHRERIEVVIDNNTLRKSLSVTKNTIRFKK